VIDAHGRRVKRHRLPLQRHVDIRAHAQEDSLAATAVVTGDTG